MNVRIFKHEPAHLKAMQWDGAEAGAGSIIGWILSYGGKTARYHEAQPATTMRGKVVRESVPALIAIGSPTTVIHVKEGDWVTCGEAA